MENIITNVIKNSILISDHSGKTAINAYLNFERVVDTEDLVGEVGIVPIFSIYTILENDSQEVKDTYKELYKTLVGIMSVLFNEVYYINTFDSSQTIYCLKDSILANNECIKVPHVTKLRMYQE